MASLPYPAPVELCFIGSSSSFAPPIKNPKRSRGRPVFVAAARRRRSASKDLQKESNKALSLILRAEAAVLGVERKARSSTSNRLWPRAVLEALDDAISSNHWESALEIFGLLRRQHWYQSKPQTYTKLITMLGKCRQPDHATSLFRTMLSEGLSPAVEVYTSLVGAYGRSGRFHEAIHTIDEMKTISDCKPNAYTYTILLDCCSKMRRFELIPELLNEMAYFGIECNAVTYNTIIDGYGKAGLLEEMEESLSNMLEGGKCLPDVFTSNSIIWAYGNAGRIDEMEKWYNEFQHMGIEPDLQTFNILIKSYGKASMDDKMILVLDFMKKRSYSPTSITFNIIVDCFGRIGNIEKMEYFFRLMKIEGVKPNSITYCSLVNAYNKAGFLEKIPVIIRQTENTDVVLDTPFFNCVISAYGQAGEVKIMKEMLLLMKEKNCKPDHITYATMIHAYNALGMNEYVKELEAKFCEDEKKALMAKSL